MTYNVFSGTLNPTHLLTYVVVVVVVAAASAAAAAVVVVVVVMLKYGPVMLCSRCWQCGCDIAAVPFEYYDYEFCSAACLKAHRQSSSTVR